LAVINLLGQSSFQRIHPDSPFVTFNFAVERLRRETPYILVDFHASTTAEKSNFFYHANSQASAVIGSHTKILTADAQILAGGTGVITDAGRTGSHHSVGGFLPEPEIKHFLTGVPERSEESWNNLVLEGIVLDLDEQGKTVSIQSIRKQCREVPHDTTGNRHED
jgi:2',3'-cyclic-nucleotide 2'-phosphodiesterase